MLTDSRHYRLLHQPHSDPQPRPHQAGQAAEVEVVLDEVLLHLAEELVALEAAEPADPAGHVLVRAARFLARLACGSWGFDRQRGNQATTRVSVRVLGVLWHLRTVVGMD